VRKHFSHPNRHALAVVSYDNDRFVIGIVAASHTRNDLENHLTQEKQGHESAYNNTCSINYSGFNSKQLLTKFFCAIKQ